MNIVILDDYQDAVRKLPCAARLQAYQAKVYTNTVKGLGQLSVRLKDADVIVLNRERTHLPRALIEKLPKLKLVVQTGKIDDTFHMGNSAGIGDSNTNKIDQFAFDQLVALQVNRVTESSNIQRLTIRISDAQDHIKFGRKQVLDLRRDRHQCHPRFLEIRWQGYTTCQ